jgi:uncharacterized coiled-coil protein SlyX
MKSIRIIGALLPLALLFPIMCLAQNSPQPDDIAKLRDQIAAQQKQLDEQRQALDAAQKALESAQKSIDSQQKLLDRLVAAQAAPAPVVAPPAALAQPAPPAPSTAEVDSVGRPFAPLGFHIGGAEFTPNGFLDFSNVWRSKDLGTGPATSFSAVPFSNTAAGRIDDFRSSAQTSRIGLSIVDHPIASMTVTGYIEADFVGNQATSLYVTSDSNTFRMRHFYANVKEGKWDVLGGQTWTLLLPNRVGVSSASGMVFLGLGEDANYLVGLPWTRPGQLRVAYHPNKQWSIAASIENPEQFATASTTLPAFAATQVDTGTLTTTPNVRPDIIAKIAYDAQVSGKSMHFELAGLSSQFRVSPAAGTFHGAQGLGGSFSASLEVAKNFRLIGTTLYTSGGARYLEALGPDFVIGPDGSLSPVHSISGIAGLEYTPPGRSQIYAYYGGDYFDRNYTLVSPGTYLGFGYPGSSNANRQIQEATFGYYYTFWKNPKYGAMQIITQYAYLTRAPWYVAAGTPTTASTSMIFGGMRFTLP